MSTRTCPATSSAAPTPRQGRGMNAENRALVERILALLEARHPQTQPELLDALGIERESREDKRVRQVILRAIRQGMIPEGWIILNSVKGYQKPATVAFDDLVFTVAEQNRGKNNRGLAYIILGMLHGDAALRARIGVDEHLEMSALYGRVDRTTLGMRRSGRIPWEWIGDNSREYDGLSMFDGLADYAEVVKNSYHFNAWNDQDVRVEVWMEKSSHTEVLRPLLDEEHTKFFVTHGIFPPGWAHRIAKMIRDRQQPLTVLWLGDFDPSGLNISDQIQEEMACHLHDLGMDESLFTLERIALTKADTEREPIRSLSIPIKDADWAREHGKRQGDSNALRYKQEHGDRCWEIDATPSDELEARVRQEIRSRRDEDVWQRSLRRENRDRAKISRWVSGWR